MGQVVTTANVMRECVCLCVSVICHSCLHSLESCLSEWSPCEGTLQLKMSWFLNSEMWMWSWGSVLRTVWSEEGFRRSCKDHGFWGHGTAGLKCSHIYSNFSRNLCGAEFWVPRADVTHVQIDNTNLMGLSTENCWVWKCFFPCPFNMNPGV